MSHRADFSVLVVDDSAASRYAVARGLQAEGYKTLEASAGAQALELADYASAVVLDVHLPDIHGLEVCRLMRSRNPELPIVHVSAVYVTEQDQRAGEEAGAARADGRRNGAAGLLHYDLMNSSRSAFTRSACVVHIPCGAPSYTFSFAFGMIFADSLPESSSGTI